MIRNATGLNLKETVDLVDKAPILVKENVSKEEGKKLKSKLEEVGAIIELVNCN